MTIHVQLGYKGSAKSGNWGHAGRPGKEGGSLPTGKSSGGAYAQPKKTNMGGTEQQTGTALTMPRLTIPVGTLPEHQKGDRDGKQAYQDWYAGLAQKPSLADALAMRRYFADRALEMEGQLSQTAAEENAKKKKAEAEEAAKAPKVLTPAEKKAQEKAKKTAEAAAKKAKKTAETAAAKKKREEESAKKKAETAAASAAKKAASAASSAAKKAEADKKKGAAAEARAQAAAKKIEEAQAKLQAKLESQIKVAESIGLSQEGFTMFQQAVSTLKAGGDLDNTVAAALSSAGLIAKSGSGYTVPSTAMTLFNAIMSADAIKARAALEKLGGTKEIGNVRMRKIVKYRIG